MDSLPAWALWPITIAVGVSPGLAILSARLIARTSTLITTGWRMSNAQPVYLDGDHLSFAARFLSCLNGQEAEPWLVDAMNLVLVNEDPSTVQAVTSLTSRHFLDVTNPANQTPAVGGAIGIWNGASEMTEKFTQRTEVYTSWDYAAIIRHLNDAWSLGHQSLSGRAAKAQDYICRQPERYESLADAIAEQVAAQPTFSFSWLRGRRA